MKSIKEKVKENLEQNEDEILCVYDRYAGFVDGANYVLDEIEKLVKFNRWTAQDLYELIEQLKK
jgi:hypothetical protein